MNSDDDFYGLSDEEIIEEKKFQSIFTRERPEAELRNSE